MPSTYIFDGFQKESSKKEENEKIVMPGAALNITFTFGKVCVRSSNTPTFKAGGGVSESVYIDFIEK